MSGNIVSLPTQKHKILCDLSLSTDNWVTPPDVEYFKELVCTEFNIVDQIDKVKRVHTPPIATLQ